MNDPHALRQAISLTARSYLYHAALTGLPPRLRSSVADEVFDAVVTALQTYHDLRGDLPRLEPSDN